MFNSIFVCFAKYSFLIKKFTIFVTVEIPEKTWFLLTSLLGSKKLKVKYMKKSRSSRPKGFCKKGVLKSFPEFPGKHLRLSPFLAALATGLRCFHVNFAEVLRAPTL